MSGFVSGMVASWVILALADGEYKLAIAFFAMLMVSACWMMECMMNGE